MHYDNPLNHRPAAPAPTPAAPAPAPAPAQPYAQQPYAQQPYAQQPYAQQPYAQPQPQAGFDYQPVEVYEEQGSYPLGFVLGLIGGLIVLVFVFSMAKAETKRGAMHAFLGKMGLVGLYMFFALATI